MRVEGKEGRGGGKKGREGKDEEYEGTERQSKQKKNEEQRHGNGGGGTQQNMREGKTVTGKEEMEAKDVQKMRGSAREWNEGGGRKSYRGGRGWHCWNLMSAALAWPSYSQKDCAQATFRFEPSEIVARTQR